MINVAGVWKEVNTPSIDVGGVIKFVDSVYINVAGTWKESYTVVPDMSNIYIMTPTMTYMDINYTIDQVPDYSVLLFTSGNYTLDGNIIINRSHISLFGESKNVNFVCNYVKTTSDGMIMLIDCCDVAIRYINIDGCESASKRTNGICANYISNINNSQDNINGLHIEDCVIKECYYNGVNINYSSNIMIKNCYIFSNCAEAVLIKNSNSNIISDNYIAHNDSTAISFDNVSNSFVKNNNILNNSVEGISIYTNSILNVISNNLIENISGAGIHIESTSSNNIIINNYINACSGSAIYIQGTYNNISSNAFYSDNDGYCLYFTNTSSYNIGTANQFGDSTNTITDGGTNNYILQ
jgi:hypothetical protein